MGERKKDADLLKSAAAGSMRACRTLVDGHLKLMLGLAYQMLGDVTEAEDIAQEAFLRLWKQAPFWRADAKISVWLYRVVYNLCIDRLRKTKRMSGEDIPEIPSAHDLPKPTRAESCVHALKRLLVKIKAKVSQRNVAFLRLKEVSKTGKESE